MLKFETIYKRAMNSKDVDIKHQAKELYNLYNDRYRYRNEQIIIDAWSVEEYKQCLKEHNIEYVEIEIEKENNKKVHMVIPSLIFRNMNSKDLGTLLKV